ncbi:sucrose phosphorylase [Caproicibacter fermentans]|uniref:Sucrose 6(F)-phosphate phosphorylase n=1 Tax=Caproicibacter fermentans TaxID=2576756 RepID=A0A7G8TFC2_9FIRM|nr:sucrose phosphorylase [Caproicibacter fermentans]QNK42313.1 sucrose phosphorylase [Caproicibacter fermentans]
MAIRNQIMLITYPDSMGKNLKELSEVLDEHFGGIIGGLHILPFFPSSADRGFAPTTYEAVDPAFGDWNDIRALANRYYLMFDFMINHISRSSAYFQDFLEKKDQSAYKDMFIRYRDFWPGGEPTRKDVDLIYKRKPRAPYIDVTFRDGTSEKIWCTFDEEQVDLAVNTKTTRDFMRKTMRNMVEKGASIIRLDAFAYAVKKRGTNCFFVEPETFDLLGFCRDAVKERDVEILPEIHEHFSIQMKLAEKDYWVYDFALPMLLLHAIYTCKNKNLLSWLRNCPRKQFTTLDTHDGIGVVDVKGLMTQEEIDQTINFLFSKGANVKKIYNTVAYNNLDVYQLNCTYYSALGDNDDAYLLARAVQFFAPGIPQVYYVGLLAGKNDIEFLEKTKVGRNINRHYYTKEEIGREVKRPILKKMYAIMRFRNSYPAFGGEVSVEDSGLESRLTIRWTKEKYSAQLHADLKTRQFEITYTGENGTQEKLSLA